MWDRRQLRPAILPGPYARPDSHPDSPSHPQLGPRKNNLRTAKIHASPAGADDYWQSSFDNRLNALGITNQPYRYEVRRGKTVPQSVPTAREISPPPDLDEALPLREPPPRNPRRLQQELQHQHHDQHQSDSAWRPASSIYPDDDIASDRRDGSHYPRPSPAAAHLKLAAREMYGRPGLEQISPPSSPDANAARGGHVAEDVSPIDEDVDMSQRNLLRGVRPTQPTPTPPAPQQHRSNIPTMRRERRKHQDVASAATRDVKSRDKATRDKQQHPVQRPDSRTQRPDSRTEANRWDGPAEPPFAGVRASTPEDSGPFGLTTTITGPQVHRSSNNASPSFGQRVRQLGWNKPETLENRPAWNGASGRTAQVQPLHDQREVAPLQVPTKSDKRGARKISAAFASTRSPASPSGPETSGGAASAVRKLLPSKAEQKPSPTAKTPSQPVPAPAIQATGAHSYPSPPHAESPLQAPHAPSEPARLSPAPLLSPETVPNANKAIKRKPPPASHANAAAHAPHLSTSSSIYSSHPDPAARTPSPRAPQSTPPNPSATDDGWVPPPSRFSITTYATSNADSPRQSLEEDRPPIPTPPQHLASVMDRRRPVPAGDRSREGSQDPVFISTKSPSVPGLHREVNPSHSRAADSVDSANRPVSVMSTSKALPLAPPEMESVNDRVAHLNARLENLAHRRININKSIKQMTELMPTDNLMASAAVLRKREIEKQKVERLREELAEIQQEEYELGLKLHRAYKRQDKDREYEPTTFWVRRVTG